MAVPILKIPQTRRKAQGRVADRRTDGDMRALIRPKQPLGRAFKVLKCAAHRGQIGPAHFVQNHTPRLPIKEPEAQMGLKRFDLLAHGHRRQPQGFASR